MQPYSPSFVVGSEVQIGDLQILEDFFRTWWFPTPLRKE
jgi:hypothetical protein